ncbi:MAG: hypothetical protein LBH34_02340 [Prevotellaceae bacterium]|jgi:hypothetical protein|nr:hypothetical protein [Prevotellaceae bacterium]
MKTPSTDTAAEVLAFPLASKMKPSNTADGTEMQLAAASPLLFFWNFRRAMPTSLGLLCISTPARYRNQNRLPVSLPYFYYKIRRGFKETSFKKDNRV